MLELCHLTKRPLPLVLCLIMHIQRKGLRNEERKKKHKEKDKERRGSKKSAEVVTLSLAHPHEGHHGRNEDPQALES
jgi:hypothetical protein